MKPFQKTLLTSSLGLAMLLSCSPFTTSVKGGLPFEGENGGDSNSLQVEVRDRFLSSFTSSLHDGISLSAKKGSTFTLDKVAGDSANVIDFSGVSLDLALDAPSLHHLKLAMNAPVSYNGKKVNLGLFLASDLFLLDLDLSRSESENSRLRYQMDLKETIFDGSNENDVRYDSELNGYACYQYGDLSWIIEELMDLLKGSDSEGSSGSSSSFSIDWSVVLDSLNHVQETSIDGLPYFTWNLQLTEGGALYPIGLLSSSSYSFSGIDLPAKNSGISSLTFGTDNLMHLSASFALESKTENKNWTIPEDVNSYQKLSDSTALFKKMGHLIKDRKFGVDGNLVLGHDEDEIPSTSTSFGHDAVHETLELGLSADLEFNGSVLQEVGANISLATIKEETKRENRIGLHLYGNEGANANAVFFDLNDALKVKTTKPVLDALVSNINDAFKGNGESSEDGGLLSGLLQTTGAIGEAVDAFKAGALNQGLQAGRYDFILDAISHLETEANQVRIGLDFSKLGFASGSADILLSSRESVAEITLSNLALGPFSIESGSLKVRDFAMPEIQNPESYDLWDHLPSISDQIGQIARTKKATFSLSGYLLKLGTTAVADHSVYNRPEEGFVFSGSFAFDLEQKRGAGKATFVDRQAKYINDHNIDIEVTGPSSIDAATNLDINKMIFRYDSKNANSQKDENRKDPDSKNGMQGYFTIHSLNDILSLAINFLQSDDPRFERLMNAFSNASTESLLGKIGNGLYFDALTNPLLESCVSSANQMVLTFPTSLFGTHTPLVLTLGFGDKIADQEGAGPLTSLRIQTQMGEEGSLKEMDITIGITSLDASEEDLHHFSTTEGFVNYSSISSLAGYIIDTASLGITPNNKVTTYHLTLSASAKIIGIGVTLSGDVYARVDGASVILYIKTHIDKFAGVTNAETYAECYYHGSGNDPEGSVLVRRATKEGGIFGIGAKWKQDQKKVKGKDFGSNMLPWIMSYMLNMSDSIVGSIENSDTSGAAIHPEDVLLSYSGPSEATPTDTPTFSLGIDLGKIAQSKVDMKINADIVGDYVDIDSKRMKTLSTASGKLAIKVLITLNVNFSLTLENVQNHVYRLCWDDSSSYRNGSSDVSGSVSSIYESMLGKEGESEFLYSDNFNSIAAWSVRP